MESIFWKGVRSTTIPGLIICELPPISKPKMRTKETEIDGRDGSVVEELGYETYNKTITIGLRGDYDIDEVIKYFTGEGDLVFSNELDKVYKARITANIDFDRLIRFRKAKVKFLVQPFKYKRDEVFKETEVATASGTSIVVGDIANEHLAVFSIYGKSTQNGTPTPDAPIDIVSLCEDGSISVSVNDQAVGLPIANGLKAVPVANKSTATYTDGSGQMWYADEIDLEKGVYIQRCYTETVSMAFEEANNRYHGTIKKKANSSIGITHGIIIICDKLPFVDGAAQASVSKINGVRISAYDQKTVIAYHNGEVIPSLNIIYPLEAPIETPLTDEQIATIKALVLNNPSATITNDENAFMKVGFFKPYEVFNEGLESSRPLMVLKGSGTVEISVNGTGVFSYTFPEGENEVVIDSEKEDAYLGSVLKNRNMNGEFPILLPKTNKIEWSGNVESIEILPRSRWL